LSRNSNGKARSIRLLETARTHLQRVGPPGDGAATGVRFTRRVRSDDHALVWWEFHPHSFTFR
jgi:hypothetical protein